MLLKIPSIDLLLEGVRGVFLRFPLAVASCLGFYLCLAFAINLELDGLKYDWVYKLMAVLSLGIALFTALHLWAERQTLPEKQKWGIMGVFALLLGVYYLFLPTEITQVEVSRHAVFVAVVHLMVAFAPFVGRRQDNAFWYFNLILFARITLTIVYCCVLALGTLGAIFSIQRLFEFDVPWRVYANIALFINILLSSFIFLSGVPDDYDSLEEATVYPIGIKFFTQYVLIPLVVAYGLILYAYGLMILFSWTLPKGMVVSLMIGFCAMSVFSLLLLHPIRERVESGWIKSFSRLFYVAILPLMLMYFVAIGRRVWQYGLTTDRYFIIMAGLWLVGIALYFTFSKEKRAILIPISLALIGLTSVLGPWSAYSVGAYSQTARFASIAIKNKLLTNGKFDLGKMSKANLSDYDQEQLKATMNYLIDQNKYPYLQPYFKENLAEYDKHKQYDRRGYLMALIGGEKPNTEQEKYASSEYFDAKRETWQKVEGYQYLVPFAFSNYMMKRNQSEIQKFALDKGEIGLSIDFKENRFIISRRDKELVSINLQTTLQNLAGSKNNMKPQGEMTVQSEGGKFKVQIRFEQIELQKHLEKNNVILIKSLRGQVLLNFE